jgi:hypothetical protein
MSDHDRGPYTPPSEPPLAFDPRRPVRGAGPAPVALIVSAVVLVGLVGGVVYVYRDGFRHGNQPPAPVGAPLGDIKAPAPADANDAAPGLVIEKVDASNDAAAVNATLAPPPEEPQPRTPVIVPAAPPPALPVTTPPAVAPARPAPQQVALAKPPKTPASVGAMADAATADRKPVKVLSKPAVAHPAEKAPPADKTAPAGANWVQIGAFTSTAQAEKGWTDIAKLEPAAMAGKGKKLETITKGGAEYYRTYVTGFDSHAAAEKFCAKLAAAKKPCIVK